MRERIHARSRSPGRARTGWRGLCLGCCIALLVHHAAATGSIGAVKSQAAWWEEAVYQAAEAAVKAIRLQSGAPLSLREVPLDTLQVYSGSTHQLGLSIDGMEYQVVLSSEQDLAKKHAAEPGPHHEALPAATSSAGSNTDSKALSDPRQVPGLVRHHWQSQGDGAASGAAARRLTLPDVTLSGPLELTFSSGRTPVTFFSPHAVDMGPVVRVKLAPGVTVKVSGMRSIQLKRHLDLPKLPLGFLAEVYAHAKLKEADEGFEKAPGIHYLAEQLKAIAVNSSLPLLSLELEPADPSLGLVILSDADVPHAPPPRLKVRVDGRGGVDVSVRQGEVAAPGDPAARASALARQWAWPLPHVDLSSLVPFEALLRSILAAHPFNLDKVQKQGIQMKLTKSEITGTRMMAFEMEVRSRAEPPNENLPDHLRTAYNTRQDTSDSSSDDTSDTPDQEQLLVFDVLVSVKEKKRAKTGGDGAAGTGPQDFEYVPVSVKLKHVYGPTLAGTPGTLHAMLTGAANGTLPSIGFDDHEDLGIARQEAEQ